MKRSNFSILLAVLMNMQAQVFAQDIAIENEDGIKIYYNYISDGKELEVTSHSGAYKNVKTLRIPSEVTYSGRKRKVTAISEDFRYGKGTVDGKFSCIYLPATINKIGKGAFCHKEYNSYSSCAEKFVITDIKAFCECGFSDGFVDNNYLSFSISYDLYYGDEETMITHLEVPAGVKYLRGLSCCESIITLTISNDVESVSDCKYMHNLQKVDMKTDKLRHIYSDAFKSCYELNNIIIGKGVEKIDGGAFAGDYNNPTTIKLVLKNDIASWCNIKSENESSDQGIGRNPFGNRFIYLYSDENTEITDLVIPEGLTRIWEYAFHNCLSFKKVTIPDKATLPEAPRSGSGAFAGCSNLENVVLGNGIDVIPEYSFYKCKSLKNVSWGKDIKIIEHSAFEGCGFISLSLPNGLETLKEAFNSCLKLQSVVIPNSMKDFKGSFIGCDKLMTVVSLINNNIPEAGYLGFDGWKYQWCNPFDDNTLMNATLYVPKGTTDAYKATNGWKDFVWIEEGLPAGAESITSNEKTTELLRYSIDGTRLVSPQKGINIVKMEDGTTKKILVK